MASSVLLKKKNQCVSLLMILTPVLISLLLLRLYKNDSWTILRPKDTTNFHSPVVVQAEAETETKTSGSVATTEIFGVKIERNPTESKLAELGVRSWPKWGCSPSKFPWTFSARETMYLLEGKVKVYCEGHDGFFEIGSGDLVEFPKGMKVTWDVIAAVSKHYSLEE